MEWKDVFSENGGADELIVYVISIHNHVRRRVDEVGPELLLCSG